MSQPPRDLIRLLKSLRAVREYTSEPISDDALNDMLDVARWSGSANNKQPVELVVVRDAQTKQKITECGVRAAAGSALSIVIVTPGEADRHDLEVFDDGRLAERLMLAAKAHGLGSNIGTLKGNGPQVIKELLGIPAEKRAWSVITLGHTDQAALAGRAPNPSAGRRAVSEFVFWDRYGARR
jgi:nitroreductase